MENTSHFVFEPGLVLPSGPYLFVRNPSGSELSAIHELARREISSGVASLEVVKSVYGHNPISFWAFLTCADSRRRNPQLVGFVAYLPLNAAGMKALQAGAFDPSEPDLTLLASAGETPAALYLWALVAHGIHDLAGKLVGHAMGVEMYARLPIFGTVGTQQGLKALRRHQGSPQSTTADVGSLFEIRHSDAYLEELRQLRFDEAPKAPKVLRPQLETMLASTPDLMAKVFAIRSAVFLGEQNCPYDEEFDGNDFAGAHVLGFVGGEPAAVLRIRYFAEFAKLERLAVLPRFRNTLIAKLVVEHAIAICRRKGYRTLYGHAQKRLVRLWQRFGFEPMAKNTRLVFSDHEYVEMMAALEPHANPLTPWSDPYVLIRPEGRWDAPGVLDRSSSRPPTNPH